MRAIGLLFLAMSCATCAPGMYCAEQPGAALPQLAPRKTAETHDGHPHDAVHAAVAGGRKRQSNVTAAKKRPNQHPGSNNDQPRNYASTKKNPPEKFPNKRKHSQSGNAIDAHQQGWDKSSSAAKGGLISRETANRASSPRSTNVIRPTAPHLTAVRHRGANPAVIGGSANWAAGNVGAISGTSVHRRP
jgi:hypothetical protein